jgi:lipopolysaccharide export system permease protein
MGLALIVFVLLLNYILQMMDRVLSKGLSGSEAGQLLLYNLAWIIALAVPMAVLVAVLMTFGRLAADNEIMAAHSCGISLVRLLMPVLGAAAVLTLLMMLFNDRVLPEWNHLARTLTTDLKRRKAALVLKQKEGIFIDDLGAYSLLVRRVDEVDNRLHGITLYNSDRPGPPPALHAEAGELHLFDDGAYIRLTLYNGEYHHVDPADARHFTRASFDRQIIHIRDDSRAFGSYRSNHRGDREMDYQALSNVIGELERQRRQGWARLDSGLQTYITDLETGSDASADSVALPRLKKQVERQRTLDDNRQSRIDKYRVELHKHFSIPTACLVFVLIGAPLGILIRRRGAAVAVGISLVFFWLYWMFLIGGEELADRGYVTPALAMWLPNCTIGTFGLYMVWAIAQPQARFLHRWRS